MCERRQCYDGYDKIISVILIHKIIPIGIFDIGNNRTQDLADEHALRSYSQRRQANPIGLSYRNIDTICAVTQHQYEIWNT